MNPFSEFVESKQTKEKTTKKDELVDFFEKRKAGAHKIATEALAKKGPFMLTYFHFAAKSKPYQEVIQAIKDDKPESFYLNHCHSLVNQLKIPKLKQKEFQEIMGRLETFGEALVQIFN